MNIETQQVSQIYQNYNLQNNNNILPSALKVQTPPDSFEKKDKKASPLGVLGVIASALLFVLALIKKAPQKLFSCIKKIFTRNKGMETEPKAPKNESIQEQPHPVEPPEKVDVWKKLFSQSEIEHVEKYVACNLPDKYKSYFQKDGLNKLAMTLFVLKNKKLPTSEEYIGILKRHNKICEHIFDEIIVKKGSNYCINSVDDLSTFLKEARRKPVDKVGLHVLGKFTEGKKVFGVDSPKSFVNIASQITKDNMASYQLIDSYAEPLLEANIKPMKFIEFINKDNFSFAEYLMTHTKKFNLNDDKIANFLKHYTPEKIRLFGELYKRLPQIQKCKLDESGVFKSMTEDNLEILDTILANPDKYSLIVAGSKVNDTYGLQLFLEQLTPEHFKYINDIVLPKVDPLREQCKHLSCSDLLFDAIYNITPKTIDCIDITSKHIENLSKNSKTNNWRGDVQFIWSKVTEDNIGKLDYILENYDTIVKKYKDKYKQDTIDEFFLFWGFNKNYKPILDLPLEEIKRMVES